MKKVIIFIILTLVVCVLFLSASFAGSYSYSDIIDTINTTIENEGFDTERKIEANFSQNFTGIIITWDKTNKAVYFDFANNDSDKSYSWQFSELIPAIKIMKAIGPLWYDLLDFDKDGCMVLYVINTNNTVKSFAYAPKVDLGDMISAKTEQYDSVEAFINMAVNLINSEYGVNETPIQDSFQKEATDEIPVKTPATDNKEDNHQYIMDQGDIQIYINDKTHFRKKDDYSSGRYIIIPIVVVNNSKNIISVKIDNTSMNGWQTYGECDVFSVPAGKKAKGQLAFNGEDAEVKKLDDFTDAEFIFVIYDSDTYETIFKSPIITITAEDNR